MSSELTRMVGIVAVALIGAITALTIFHPGDNIQVIGQMVTGALALLAFLSSRTNAAKIEDTSARTDAVHTIVNAQRDAMLAKIDELAAIVAELHMERLVTAETQRQLLAAEKGVSHAAGVEAERERLK